MLKWVRLKRERERLLQVAEQNGYESIGHMLLDLYEVQRIPVAQISRQLYTPLWTLRKLFDEFGIQVRGRGGRNNVKVEMTKELYDEVCRDGIRAVSIRVGVDYITLWYRVKAFEEQKGQQP